MYAKYLKLNINNLSMWEFEVRKSHILKKFLKESPCKNLFYSYRHILSSCILHEAVCFCMLTMKRIRNEKLIFHILEAEIWSLFFQTRKVRKVHEIDPNKKFIRMLCLSYQGVHLSIEYFSCGSSEPNYVDKTFWR